MHPADTSLLCRMFVVNTIQRVNFIHLFTSRKMVTIPRSGLQTQSWSNGSIGTFGGSYVAATQWQAALMHNPHVKAMFPYVGASDIFNSWIYNNGASALSFNVMWGAVSISAQAGQNIEKEPIDWQEVFKILPVSSIPDSIGRNVPWYKDWVKNNIYNDYWKRWNIEEKYSEIDIPAFNMGGWYDVFLEGTLNNFIGMRSQGKSEKTRKSQKLVVGPWYHTDPATTKLGQVEFGPDAGMDMNDLMLQWFDCLLKGTDKTLLEQPPVKIFVMGKNEWRYEDEWPLKRTKYTNFYLHSKYGANSLSGDGSLDQILPDDEQPDTFEYDPADPVPTVGGNNCCVPSLVTEGPYDQRAVEMRNDVLVFTTEELKSDMEVTGPITVKLYASTLAVNTDFTAKLTDVHPGGKSINISNGILRTIYRNSLEKIEWTEPGKIYEYTIKLRPTSNVFLAGHRIRLEISSSNFPRYDRNLNTKTINDGTEMITAIQDIYHNTQYPSFIVLPIIPAGEK